MKKQIAASLILFALTASACAGKPSVSPAESSPAAAATATASAVNEVQTTAPAATAAAAASAVNEVQTTAPAAQEPATAAPQPTTQNTRWKGSYMDFVGKFDKGTFGLIDLDNNGIPELVYDSQVAAYGSFICSYTNGSLQSIQTASHNIRYENNRILSVSGKMGSYRDMVYELNDGVFTCVFTGEYRAKNKSFNTDNPYDFDYSFAAGDASVLKSASYEDYIAAREALISKDEATMFETPYDKGRIIELIQNY